MEVARANTLEASESDVKSLDSDVVQNIFDKIEDELRVLLGEISQSSIEVAEAIGVANKSINCIRSKSGALSEKAQESQQVSSQLSLVTEQLNLAAKEIGEKVEHSVGMVDSAVDAANQTKNRTTKLSESSVAIGSVVSLISDIAKQTNLLALNATIEAARAGEAGKGFSVVASEVKQLSSQTQNATETIQREIDRLRTETDASVAAIEKIFDFIEEIKPVFATVAAAIEEQNTSFDELLRTAQISSEFIGHVTTSAVEIDEEAKSAEAVNTAADLSGQAINRLLTRALVVLRQNEVANRRILERVPHSVSINVTCRGSSIRRNTVDIGEGGVLFVPEAGDDFHGGDSLTVNLESCGKIDARITTVSDLGVHVKFISVDEDVLQALRVFLDDVTRQNQKLIEVASNGALQIAEGFDRLLRSGEITEQELFDTSYQKIEGTDPVQFTVAALPTLEQVLPDIQEAILQSMPQMTFCAAVDRNGYLPVHNKIYSHPQRESDPIWNNANCRNKRIFDDRAGLAAAHNLQPHLVQTYQREVGSEKIMMKEIDCPILVNGRHWGGFRTAYKL